MHAPGCSSTNAKHVVPQPSSNWQWGSWAVVDGFLLDLFSLTLPAWGAALTGLWLQSLAGTPTSRLTGRQGREGVICKAHVQSWT